VTERQKTNEALGKLLADGEPIRTAAALAPLAERLRARRAAERHAEKPSKGQANQAPQPPTAQETEPSGGRVVRLPIRLVAPAVLVAAAAVALLVGRPGFRVDGARGVVGTPVVATAGRTRTVAFDDRSQATLTAGSAISVTEVTRHGGRMRLENGEIDVAVVHHEDTRYTLESGPFSVTVIGTQFRLGWLASEQRLDLHMREGRVHVRGCGKERDVAGTEEISWRCEAAAVPGALSLVASSVPSVPPSVPELAVPAPSPAPSHADPPLGNAPSADDRFRKALASGDGAAILAAARADFDGILARADGKELGPLGDAARRLGAPEETAIWTAAQRRFPGSPLARTAAFHLGRKAAAAGDRSAAARWLTDATADPSAPFYREALGRLVEVANQQGDTVAAKRNASKYLAAFPDGPHAALARTIVAKDGP
jgi:ferric-dicitrate binding protein FerR (iron transport regulator)